MFRKRSASKRIAVFVSIFFLAVSEPEALAQSTSQLRVRGAEVACDANPPLVMLHGDFGSQASQVAVILDLPAGPTTLWVAYASSAQIDAVLPGCDPPGTYRLTVGYGTDNDSVTTNSGKVRPPQFYTALDVTLGAVGPTGPEGPRGERGPEGLQGLMGPAGMDGADGLDGVDGLPGIACWDRNENRTCDLLQYDPINEDINGDLQCTPLDCLGPQGPPRA